MQTVNIISYYSTAGVVLLVIWSSNVTNVNNPVAIEYKEISICNSWMDMMVIRMGLDAQEWLGEGARGVFSVKIVTRILHSSYGS